MNERATIMSEAKSDKRYEKPDNLKHVAFEYWQLGHRIVPIVIAAEKAPLVEWKHWQNEEQSLQDFEVLPWEQANGFAIVCGVKLNNGFYAGALDFDVEKSGEPLGEDVLKKQADLVKNMPVTQHEQTPTRGKHFIYYSHAPVETKQDDRCGIEVLGSGKLCIMAPSHGYKRLNDNMPTEVQNLNLKFEEALAKVGLKMPVSKASFVPARKKRRKGKLRYCCEVALQRDRNIAHLMRLAMASEYKKLGWSDDDIVDLFRRQEDFEKNKCLTQVRSADPERAATCESIREWGYCYPECSLREWGLDEAIDYELRMVDSIELHPNIDYHPKTGLTVGAFLQTSGKILQIINQNVKMVDSESRLIEELNPMNVSVKQPSPLGISRNQSKEILLVSRELKNGVKLSEEGEKNVSDLLLKKALHYFYHPDQRWHLAIACFVIITYHHRLFAILAHLVFQGPRGSGKTTMGLFLKSVCWNPTGLQAGLRSAPLFRSIEASRPTFFADLTKVDVRDVDLIDLFEVIEQDGSVRRCVGEENEPVDFYVFCPKVLMVRQSVPFSDKCIECVTEPAPKATPYTERRRFIPVDLELMNIRLNLLRSAISNWRLVLSAYEGLQQDERLFGRRFDLWRPLLAVCKVYYPDRYSDLLSLAYEDAEKAEKGDLTSDVEDLLLAYFLVFEVDSQMFLLKDLTEHAQKQMGTRVVRSYHIVASALKNLGLIKSKLQTSDGVKFQIDLAKARSLASERKIEKSSAKPKILDGPFEGTCSICGEHGSIYRTDQGVMCNICLKEIDMDKQPSQKIETLKPSREGLCMFCGQRRTLIWSVEGSEACRDCGIPLVVDVSKIEKIQPLDPIIKGNCSLCESATNLVLQVLLKDGSRYDAVCIDCGGRIQNEFKQLKEA